MQLELLEPAWIDDKPINTADQCAHGRIRLVIDGTTLISPSDGDFTVSAAALYLLRTMDGDSTEAAPVAEGCQVVPCCAHAMFTTSDSRFGFLALGCPNGIDLDVVHQQVRVRVRRRGTDFVAETTDREWAKAVLNFAGQVRAFYDRGGPKLPPSDPVERDAWSMFWSEWKARVQSARS